MHTGLATGIMLILQLHLFILHNLEAYRIYNSYRGQWALLRNNNPNSQPIDVPIDSAHNEQRAHLLIVLIIIEGRTCSISKDYGRNKRELMVA